jgi:hypothetical protein
MQKISFGQVNNFPLTVPNSLMADVDAALMKQVFDVAEREWETNVQHHRQANDIGTGFEVAKWRTFCHPAKLRNHPARLKSVLSDSAKRRVLC